ncbi:MAG: bacteriohemerythrin [Chromatiales bacterium]|nr:bacteriohemerythrin [Chromatiales bacterium]
MTTQHLKHSDLTGIGVIDDQHEEILGLINSLTKSAKSGQRDRVETMVDSIVPIILAHFEFEEELMEQADYTYLKVHKRLHDHFIQRLADYTHRFDNGESIAVEMANFMSSWLRGHFTREDRDYSPQVLAEMSGLTNDAAALDSNSWFSRTLRKIA